ncbi:MAG: EAL domain-containing protein, partial [Pseudomonadota bacterium]
MGRHEDTGMGAKALTLTSDDLDEALDSNQIRLLYQPIFSLVDGALVRVEALCRWDHPRFGTMLPAVFLPAFEAEERLNALTETILRRGATEFATWPLRSPAALSINLAPRDCINPRLPELVASVLEST